jgi:2,3-bisphosphoglycerate-dependent phosphoglycerate mutase
MTTLLLARHGETDWNSERRWQGHADRPLNARGREQAHELAESLAGRRIDAIYASDLLRARETAEIVGAELGLPVTLDRNLREVDVGEWSGLVHTEIESRYPEGFRRWQQGLHGWVGGESYDEMGERVVRALVSIAARHPGETVFVVSHGGAIRACQATAAGLRNDEFRRTESRPTPNCAVFEFVVADGRLAGAAG